MLFANKIVLVTGAASGIGRATALAFAREGAVLVVSDIDDAGGAAVVDTIARAGGTASYHRADMLSAADIEALMQGVLSRHGRLDCAHNNVGFSRGDGLAGISEADWDFTVDICLKAPFLCMKHQMPIMQAQGGGSIVNTASMAGVRHAPAANAAYSAAKAGVIAMTQYAAVTGAPHSVRVNAVSPGLVRTPAIETFIPRDQQDAYAARYQPIGRIIEPEEIAQTVLFLCSDRASMITGENIAVAGGAQAS